jgi:hypothetical protein
MIRAIAVANELPNEIILSNHIMMPPAFYPNARLQRLYYSSPTIDDVEPLLAAPAEALDVEYKCWLDLRGNDEHTAALAKAAIALANEGGVSSSSDTARSART